jgi:antitoxin component of RelBE/YafQ-DinJ toxin-antitoxin module
LGTFTFQIDDNLFSEIEKVCETIGITPEEGLAKAVEHSLDTGDYDRPTTSSEQRLLAMIMGEASKWEAEEKARIKEERKDLIRRVK